MDKKLSTELLQGIEGEFLQTYENLLKVLQGEINYRDFEKKLKELLDKLGCTILKQVLENLDEKIRENKEERPGYWVERRDDEKSVLTVFGKVNYTRTYYRNKHDGICKHLVDEIAGYTPHMKVDPVVKGELLDHAAEKSYEKATKALSLYNAGKKLSRQTVSNIVKSFDNPRTYEEQEPKKEVPVVYIEADEDHLSVRGNKRLYGKLAYVHEGIRAGRLKSPKYFSGVTKDSEDLWFEILDYIYSTYDVENLEQIYISGDGARWIRQGTEYIPGSKFVLDKFHLNRALLRATAHSRELRSQAYNKLNNFDKEGVLEVLKKALSEADSNTRRERIKTTIKYIDNNWEGIEAWQDSRVGSCSAEGHVSHVLSSRMSSRPMTWSKEGAENMAALCTLKASGENIQGLYLQDDKASKLDLSAELEKELKKYGPNNFGKEARGNVPGIITGSERFKAALKALKDKTA